MNRLVVGFSLLAALAGCATVKGTYVLNAYDATGKELGGNMQLTATGRSLYAIRNALCSTYPQAVVRIKGVTTQEELKSDSPYQCR